MTERLGFRYVAVDAVGRRKRGVVEAQDQRAAFLVLKRDGLTPLSLQSSGAAGRTHRPPKTMSQEALSAFLHDLAALLAAGADIRSALSVMGARPDQAGASAAKALAAQISGGTGLEQAFGAVLGEKAQLVAGLVAAGEASGDLPGALGRGAALIASAVEVRKKLVAALSYPAFVFVLGLCALLIILLVVVPSLAPLMQSGGAAPPATMRFLMSASGLLVDQAILIVLLGLAAIAGLGLAWRNGLLRRLVDRALLDGPLRRTVRGVVYGNFSISLGELLAAGVPKGEALRIAVRAVRSPGAFAKLEAATQLVRRGERLSAALDQTRHLPHSIGYLARIGEETGALGPMLLRSGRLETERALARIDALSQWVGPVLIVVLGALIGLLMTGLLSGVAALGDSALQGS